MKKSPALWDLAELVEWAKHPHVTTDHEGAWVPGRPLGLYTLGNRIRTAWGVFTGKYDAVKWPAGQ